MHPSLSFPVMSIFFAFTLTFLFCVSLSSPAFAQVFRPAPDSGKCSAFVEGQAFYLLGGSLKENFMLDLSVPWNTSDPAFKELKDGPTVEGRACATTNTGGLSVFTEGAGFIYDQRPNSWTSFENANLSTSAPTELAVAGPETGIIYIKEEKERTMHSVDLKAKTVKNSDAKLPSEAVDGIAWSAYLKSMVVVDRPVTLFTPSEVTESSSGWSTFVATNQNGTFLPPLCTAPAYGGSAMVILGDSTGDTAGETTSVYVLDLITRSWRQGPIAAGNMRHCSCAVSGDQFIVWGGIVNERDSNRTLVFNIKTGESLSTYTPPPPLLPPQPTMTTLQPSETLAQPAAATPEPGDILSSDKQLVIIIVAVIGTLLASTVGLIFRYHRRRRQSDPNGSSTSSLDININDSGKDDPSEAGHARLRQGAHEAREPFEHSHATVESTSLESGAQEGSLIIRTPPPYYYDIDNQGREDQ